MTKESVTIEGLFSRNLPNGDQMVINYPNGDQYTGAMRDGVIEGFGKLVRNSNNTSYTG